MQKIGKVLWWDARDCEGVLIDENGSKVYFNKSVLSHSSIGKKLEDQFVFFEVNKRVSHVLCASEVLLIPARKLNQLKKQNPKYRHLSAEAA